ncbi:hypothetical protein SprV_0401531600 [Sparganum proliferum]
MRREENLIRHQVSSLLMAHRPRDVLSKVERDALKELRARQLVVPSLKPVNYSGERCNRPERRTTLVARELARHKVEIAALGEARFSEQGQLEEVDVGYTFFWSGRSKAERRDAGVAYAILDDIVKAFAHILLNRLHEHLEQGLLPVSLDTFGPNAPSIRQCLPLLPPSPPAANPAPTSTPVLADHTVAAPPPPFTDVIRAAPTSAPTGATSITNTTAPRTSPTDGVTFCVISPSTIIANTATTSVVDNTLVQRLVNFPLADAADENASVKNRWRQLRDTVQSTVMTVLGRARRQPHDWFDDNDAAISNLLAETNRLHKAYVTRPTDDTKAAFCRSRRLVQQRLRKMQDAWTARKAKEIQGYADRNE